MKVSLHSGNETELQADAEGLGIFTCVSVRKDTHCWSEGNLQHWFIWADICFRRPVYIMYSLPRVEVEPIPAITGQKAGHTLDRKFKVDPDTEGILSVKSELKGQGCKDSVLLSNLDFAESIFRHHPLSKAMSLLVKGEWQCVRIGSAEDIIYTITSENNQGRLDGCIYCEDDVSESDIKSIHFSMHSCQDEIKSCFAQAKEAVNAKNVEVVKIACNRFSLTYAIRATPEKMVTIKTNCRFKLAPISVEGLLERKCWMAKEKAGCKGLKAGLDHLINKYLTVPDAPKSNCKFIIQGDGEIAEIISPCVSNKPQEQFILMNTEYTGIAMYPPSWGKS
ncbi:hypothetical protein MHYP_G00047200 [Metynnis hypsauchen]